VRKEGLGMTNRLRSFLLAGAVSLSLGALGTPAGATVPDETFYFTGTCADCTGDGPGGEVTATLVLMGYVPGGPDFLPGNFVSFSYGGSNLVPGFTLNASTPGFVLGQLIGSFSPLPGPNFMTIAWAITSPTDPTDTFTTNTDGTWTLSIPEAADGGTNGSWSLTAPGAVPEPATWAMMGIGFAGLAFAGYRARKRTAAVA
jgi:hypothetical protein